LKKIVFMPLPNRSQKQADAGVRLPARLSTGSGPYQSLALLLIPLSIVEPLKLAAVAVAGPRGTG